MITPITINSNNISTEAQPDMRSSLRTTDPTGSADAFGACLVKDGGRERLGGSEGGKTCLLERRSADAFGACLVKGGRY